MKYFYAFLFLVYFTIQVEAQAGAVNFIDTSLESAGISEILAVDLNNDGFKDIITSTTGNLGRLGYYINQTNNTFSSFNEIDTFEFCRGVAVGNFNNDNVPDFVAIGNINNESKIYINTNGSYTSFVLDTNLTVLNDVVVGDFDQNNSDDIVIIGQHSIDFYRNNGSGSFMKEEILTTSTSPLVLECLDLAVKDMDNDGDLDLICGETAGLVVYTNNGNGIFTSNYYSITSEVFFLVHPFDVDHDGDYDVVGRNNAGQVKWFSNNGNGVLSFEATLATIPNLISLHAIDYNNDGLEDIYASYLNHIAIFQNDNNHTFSNEISLYQNSNLIMGVVTPANIDNQGGLDYVWCGSNHVLAFQINETTLSLSGVHSNSFRLFPNPTNGIINTSTPIEKMILYNLMGVKLMEIAHSTSIDISNFPSGIYILSITDKGINVIQKIIKK